MLLELTFASLLFCRLVQAYNQAAATLNLLRGFSTGGYAGLQRVTQWNLDFMDRSDEGQVHTGLRLSHSRST